MQVQFFLIFSKESVIAFTLFRVWRWTAAPGVARGPLSPTRASPCPPRCAIHVIYIINPATGSHHFSSSHMMMMIIISLIRPLPSPTHGHPSRCAAFCGVCPSITHTPLCICLPNLPQSLLLRAFIRHHIY